MTAEYLCFHCGTVLGDKVVYVTGKPHCSHKCADQTERSWSPDSGVEHF